MSPGRRSRPHSHSTSPTSATLTFKSKKSKRKTLAQHQQGDKRAVELGDQQQEAVSFDHALPSTPADKQIAECERRMTIGHGSSRHWQQRLEQEQAERLQDVDEAALVSPTLLQSLLGAIASGRRANRPTATACRRTLPLTTTTARAVRLLRPSRP